jgi:transcriptional regulator with GAF, ATPase, and Fis domain
VGGVPVGGDGIVSEDQMVELQKKNLLAALDRTGWKIYGPGGTAELLGLRPTTLASRIKKFDLKRSR